MKSYTLGAWAKLSQAIKVDGEMFDCRFYVVECPSASRPGCERNVRIFIGTYEGLACPGFASEGVSS